MGKRFLAVKDGSKRQSVDLMAWMNATDTTTQHSTFLTVDEAARVLSCSSATLYRKIAKGELPVLRLGDGPKAPIRIDIEDLRVWLVAAGRGRVERAVMPS